MIAAIKKFFETEIEESAGQLDEHKRQLACAALLIEVATIDQEFDAREFETMQGILQNKFDISAEECAELTNLAQQEKDDASSTYQFTRLVNDHFDNQEKFDLVKAMWDIAYADGQLDKYEEYIIRKVSDLLYVAHGDFIRAKHAARSERGAD